jgi:hypothetical protein
MTCAGDRWLITKYDRYGNRVSAPEALTDNGGRSPSEQLSQPADDLAAFLHSRGHPLTIRRIVWFTHRRARLGTCTDPTVHIAFSVSQVLALLSRPRETITGADCTEIEQLITRDHRYHAARRAQRGSASGRPPGRRPR